jgi:hypothetical protein
MRPVQLAAIALVLAAQTISAQTTFSLSAYAYFVPEDRDYVQPTFTLDRDRLHLEARYNYENLDTTSLWVGYNISHANSISFDFTAKVGAVFGKTDGIAPGYSFTLGWRGFELYSDGEYVFDTHDSAESFFYTWSELSYSPLEWLRAGLVIQRTKAYATDFDIQRGLFVGFTFKHLDFTVYVLNPDNDPTTVLGVSFEF